MKGGKGGRGRSNAPSRGPEKPGPRGGAKKGAPKRDWGAVPKDDRPESAPPAGVPSRDGRLERRDGRR